MRERARLERGFGLVELIIAMTIMQVAILALVAAFNAGALSIVHASRVSTSAALADRQMELYRALTYGAIALAPSEVTTANGDPVYAGDAAWSSSQLTSASACTGTPPQCKPTQTVTGPDGKRFRIDTYIVQDQLTDGTGTAIGRPFKKVTVVVRSYADPTLNPYFREQSTFDQSTG